ncbi:MAG TPA: hypothetical protein VN493_00265 [Thermoanaerobaculia bacterium]|nr:hypothetical protein [Thermoanaerobaculia bacterium]
MSHVLFLVFDQQNRLVLRAQRGRFYAKSFAQAKRACFDFYLLGEGVDPRTVGDIRSTLPTSLSLGDIEGTIDRFFTPPTPATPLGVVLLPKDEVGWISMRTGTYSPNLAASNTEMSFASQARLLMSLLDQAIQHQCRIFVAPEQLVFKGTGRGRKEPFSQDEKDELEGILANQTNGRDLALFLPGTIWWQDAGGQVHNSLLAFSEGASLGLDYDKKNWTGEEVAAARDLGSSPVQGACSYSCFNWKGFEIGVQICADCADALGRAVDIHVILGWGTGAPLLRQRAGGLGIYTDSQGRGSVEDEFGPARLDADAPGTITATEAFIASSVHRAPGDWRATAQKLAGVFRDAANEL